jgi:hypothetical protein
MSWIQENRFAAGLGGFTAVAAIGLIFWAVSEGSQYSKSKEDYDASAEKIKAIEAKPLYPSEENLRAKNNALSDYYNGVEKLQKAFDPYRTGELKLIDPAAFTEELKKVKGDADTALTGAKVELDPKFYLGFETYTNAAVRGSATGILGYELGAVAELFRELAEAKPTKVNNVYRLPLEEESGGTFDAKDKSFRALPIELTFTGTEASLRSFLSALDDSKKYYYVIRAMKVSNTEQKAPNAAAAQFKAEDAAAVPEAGGGDSGIVLPPDAGSPAPEATPAAAPSGAGEGKILQQVLGAEKVQVFLRIDILQFLGSRELPKP